ncbi:hypothetical protein [Paucibacter sp. KCTC 42545]|uniref:hypothetical protein n=1 Tax=Paucibacter sp. KCTC 42545 TaxID=1768242 RepID=UPI000733C055|nr:hypothetical protein [Paucibacter sp. KCTC 42545]ALT77902.1 hypothetical protein AT984_12635 [Paucibacter sp. KCTC 42545]
MLEFKMMQPWAGALLRALPLALLSAAAASAGLSNGMGADAERAALQRQSAAIEAQFNKDSEACQSRFMVTACLDQARQRREQALRPLQQRLDALSLAERRARAEAQREAVQARQREFESREGQRRTEALLRAPSADAANQPLRDLRAPRAPLMDRREREDTKATQQTRAEQEAAKRAEQSQKRLQQMQAHQAEAQRRNEERLKKQAESGKPAPVSLPVPPAAQLPARVQAPLAASAPASASSSAPKR